MSNRSRKSLVIGPDTFDALCAAGVLAIGLAIAFPHHAQRSADVIEAERPRVQRVQPGDVWRRLGRSRQLGPLPPVYPHPPRRTRWHKPLSPSPQT